MRPPRALLAAAVLAAAACGGPLLAHDTWWCVRSTWSAPGAGGRAAVSLLRFCPGGRAVALEATLERGAGRLALAGDAPLALYEGDWWTVAAGFATRMKLTRAVPAPRELEPVPERSLRIAPRNGLLEVSGAEFAPLPVALPEDAVRMLSCAASGPVTHD